jgi:hypothetical protein
MRIRQFERAVEAPGHRCNECKSAREPGYASANRKEPAWPTESVAKDIHDLTGAKSRPVVDVIETFEVLWRVDDGAERTGQNANAENAALVVRLR